MQCPLCKCSLQRVRYEDFVILHCDQCKGYLVGEDRSDAIKRKRDKTIEDLKAEVINGNFSDSTAALRCPRCRQKMAQEWLRAPASFTLDKCPDCKLWWFDGSELARYQLAYQISPQGQEAAELQRRLAELDDQRRQEFENNLAQLPEHKPLGQLLLDLFFSHDDRHVLGDEDS